jgi:hypothetical protein
VLRNRLSLAPRVGVERQEVHMKRSTSIAVAGTAAAGGTLTIVGGTGAWVGAGGTDTIVNQPDGIAIHTVKIAL